MTRHETDQCDVCDVWPIETTPATVVDHSGASFIYVCSGCREALTRDRCRSCGRTMAAQRTRKNAGIQFQPDEGGGSDGDTPPVLPLCDDCRRAVVFGSPRPSDTPDTVGADGPGTPAVDKAGRTDRPRDVPARTVVPSDGGGGER